MTLNHDLRSNTKRPGANAAAARRRYLSPEERAHARADERFGIGQDAERALLEHVLTMKIQDKLAAPRGTHFELLGADSAVHIVYSNDPKVYRVHPHALGQLAEAVGFPVGYAQKQRTHDNLRRRKLLCTNLNELFDCTEFVDRDGQPERFLHRIVETELRGFLTRRFKRHLHSVPLLRAFVEVCRQSGARPVEAFSSAVRFALKCFLPQVFEAFPGQFLCVGVQWSNSDFGAARMQLCQTVWDPLSDVRVILDHAISRVHLGSVIEEADLEMSDATAAQEINTLALAISDTVQSLLGEEKVERLLEGIRAANEQRIPWTQLRGQLATFLGKKEIKSLEELLTEDVIDLPPPGRDSTGASIPTRWWAASAVSRLAGKATDEERKLELQREAGALLAASMKGEAT